MVEDDCFETINDTTATCGCQVFEELCEHLIGISTQTPVVEITLGPDTKVLASLPFGVIVGLVK